MELESVNNLSNAGVAYEKALRALRKRHNTYLNALEAVASEPAINKMGLFQIDTAEYRVRAADAQLHVEQAHKLICDNHHGFNAIAKREEIEVTTREGGR